MMKYKEEKQDGNNITWITVLEPNSKKETMLIELVECTNSDGNKSLPYLWYKAGFTDKILETYLCIHTYCTDSEGMCYGRYNPQIKLSEDGKRHVINFDWKFENTEENKQKLINEVIRLFESATGKSATELKLEKIKKFAEEHELNIFETIPEGWTKYPAASFPIGCTRIVTGKSFMRNTDGKLVRNPNYKEAILIY